MEQARTVENPWLKLERIYPVAPEKVWRAWTDPQALRRWWGPPNEPVSLAELDVRVGGRFRIVFGGKDGKEHECAGVYKEVVPNRRLAFTWSWPRTTPERVSLVTILFNASAGGTELVLKHEQFFDDTARDGHNRGWTVALEKLGVFLGSAS